MVTLKRSRFVLGLLALATASGELADDFNIPDGWRMEVKWHTWISIASPNMLSQPADTAARAQQALSSLCCFFIGVASRAQALAVDHRAALIGSL